MVKQSTLCEYKTPSKNNLGWPLQLLPYECNLSSLLLTLIEKNSNYSHKAVINQTLGEFRVATPRSFDLGTTSGAAITAAVLQHNQHDGHYLPSRRVPVRD